jgi:CO dehydrogenase maturation factor
MRIAVAGKGGAGKTTISATLARLQARGGQRVVAIDADSNPNLGIALGADTTPVALPATIVSRRVDGGPALSAPLASVLAEHSVPGPDGVWLVTMGAPDHAEQGCLCAAHATVRALLADLGEQPGWTTIMDLEASPEHLSRGTARHADVLLLVAEPYFRSLETVRRMAALAAELPIPRVAVVANKVRAAADAEAVRELCARHGLEHAGAVPWSEAVIEADRARAAVIERMNGQTVVEAVGALAARLLGAGLPDGSHPS